MTRFLLAAAAALALWAQPAFAGDCEHCKDCPHHKAAQSQGTKDDKAVAVGCKCAGEGKECKCGPGCQCPHCAQHQHAQPEKQEKKS